MDQLQLLAHFDGASRCSPADCETVPDGGSRRGVGWVLKWAAALAGLIYSATVLAEFGYALTGERLLARAARAGVLEATLPRATPRSVEQTVWRRLEGRVGSRGAVKLVLLVNGTGVGQQLRPQGGDRLTLSLAMPSQTMMPHWLRTFSGWRRGAIVEARADEIVPGRKLLAGSRL
jgi:hypothetical protein